MTDAECNAVVSKCLEWLGEGFSAQYLGGDCVVTTPFLDRRNDHIQIRVRKRDGRYVISDGGTTMPDMVDGGFSLGKTVNKELVAYITSGYGVQLDDKANSLGVEADDTNVGQRMNFLLQAIMAMNSNVPVPALPKISPRAQFENMVSDHLQSLDIFIKGKAGVPGISGYLHEMETVSSTSDSSSTRYFKAFHSPDKRSVKEFLFQLEDVHQYNGGNGIRKSIAVLNDEKKPDCGSEINALEKYDVAHALWMKRDDWNIQELFA